MNHRLLAVVAAALVLLLPAPVFAWNATGHQLIAAIAWDRMTPAARQQAIALLRAAPADACLLNLFPTDSRPLDVRQREFFVRASTWSDLVRPDRKDTRPCTRFHRRDWHFINFFWSGVSGGTGVNLPTNRTEIAVPTDNVVERLAFLRPLVACTAAPCGTPRAAQATALAWMLHLVGDIHQPLHSTARVTTQPDERQGDQGGNLFKLGPASSPNPLSLHSYWDGIIDRAVARLPNEGEQAYVSRVSAAIVTRHPLAAMSPRLKSSAFAAWSSEGFETTKRAVYPSTLTRGQMPLPAYQSNVLTIAQEAIALGGYRLADLLNQMFV